MINTQDDQVVSVRVVCVIILFAGPTAFSDSQVIPNGTDVAMVQFDATFGLSAPIAGTQIVIFARYWITQQDYTLAVVWIEPHSSGFNFSTYPVSMIIESGKEFRISNQLRDVPNRVYPKPIGSRGAFLHVFNSYPIFDIRFAESEALARRLYIDDLEQNPPSSENGWHDLVLTGPPSKPDIERDLKRLRWYIDKNTMTDLQLFDTHDQMVTSVHYDYSTQSPNQLKRQTAVLPERQITAELKGKGFKVTKDGNTEQHNRFRILHHGGGRKCIINYSPFKINDAYVSLPTHINVRRQDTEANLRSVRMENHIIDHENPKDIYNLAESFCHYNSDERKCQALWFKYWCKPIDTITAEDKQSLQTLRTRFESNSMSGKTTGELLKHINMLIQLGWMQHDERLLSEQFEHYLEVLHEAQLDHVQLTGGQDLIDTTARWNQFKTANVLLNVWIETVISICNSEVLTSFAARKTRKGSPWTSIKLMDRLLKLHRNDPRISFEASFVRSLALSDLHMKTQRPDKDYDSRTKAQIKWASREFTADDLCRELKASITYCLQQAEKIEITDNRDFRAKIQWLSKQKAILDNHQVSTPKEN